MTTISKTPSHTAKIPHAENLWLVVAFVYTQGYTHCAPYIHPDDIEAEINILSYYYEDDNDNKTACADLDDIQVEAILLEHEYHWKEVVFDHHFKAVLKQ